MKLKSRCNKQGLSNFAAWVAAQIENNGQARAKWMEDAKQVLKEKMQNTHSPSAEHALALLENKLAH